MIEKWMPIPGYAGFYEVSNTGKIKALPIETKFGKQIKRWPERFLKQWVSITGYHYVTLSVSGVTKKIIVHRIVAICFIKNPSDFKQVNHKDGNKNNNSVDNLEWCSAQHNLKHARDMGLNKSIGCDNAMSKLTPKQVFEIRNHSGMQKEMAEKYTLSAATISRIKSRKSYKNVR